MGARPPPPPPASVLEEREEGSVGAPSAAPGQPTTALWSFLALLPSFPFVPSFLPFIILNYFAFSLFYFLSFLLSFLHSSLRGVVFLCVGARAHARSLTLSVPTTDVLRASSLGRSRKRGLARARGARGVGARRMGEAGTQALGRRERETDGCPGECEVSGGRWEGRASYWRRGTVFHTRPLRRKRFVRKHDGGRFCGWELKVCFLLCVLLFGVNILHF